MKKRIWLWLLLLPVLSLPAQNLVTNPGFETGPCPTNYSQINMVPGWYSPTSGTPDHLSTCATGPEGGRVSIPDNGVGWQQPHSGNAYAGIICYNVGGVFFTNGSIDTFQREYIQSKLIQPLVPGKTYQVRFYVSLADGGVSKANINYATDDLGAHFSVDPVTKFTFSQMPLRLLRTPQIRNPEGNFITSTIEWTEISGCFTADSAYQHITIGCFAGADISLLPVNTLPTDANTIYYYIDDVSVVEMPDPGILITGDYMICNDVAVTLETISGDSVRWSTGENTLSIQVSTPGIVHVNVTTGGCTYTDSVMIAATYLQPNLGDDISLCDITEVLLDGTSDAPQVQYLWNTGVTMPVITVHHSGTYWLEQSAGNCRKRDSIRVDLGIPPILELGTDHVLCRNEFTILDAGLDAEKYQLVWNTGENTQHITITEPGLYTVTATNACGSTEDRVEIWDGGNCRCPVFVPNTFTPGNNGLNDLFGPVSACVFSEFRLDIFNRWGELIFTSSDPQHQWNGTHQQSGIYLWKLHYALAQTTVPRQEEMTGHVLLLR